MLAEVDGEGKVNGRGDLLLCICLGVVHKAHQQQIQHVGQGLELDAACRVLLRVAAAAEVLVCAGELLFL